MCKKKIAVLFGGASSEYDISLLSSAAVIRNFPLALYDLVLLGITREGFWFLYDGSPESIEDGTWIHHESNIPAFLSPDRNRRGIVALPSNQPARYIHIDAVFPVLHGRNGEDGRIQGLLEMAAIPYVGCDVLASAVCMDKAVANTILDHSGIRRVPWTSFFLRDLPSLDTHITRWERAFGWPMFVKPANAGSSVGISKAKDRASLTLAVHLAFEHDRKIIVEKCVVGKELECGVLGNENPVASRIGEILPGNEFYDYDAKYHSDSSKTVIPACISAKQEEEARRIALTAFSALGCTGMARVDFFLEDSTGDILVNELNTIPGFTAISMYQKLFTDFGFSYSELISRLITLAFERMNDYGSTPHRCL